MKFQLVRTLAKQLSVTAEEAGTSAAKRQLDIEQLQVSVRVPEQGSPQSFAICFEVIARATLDDSESLNINCEYWAFFESDQPLNDEFLDGHFPRINAPAIAYPYLRSFITTVLVNAGYAAMHLPTVNFIELAKQD